MRHFIHHPPTIGPRSQAAFISNFRVSKPPAIAFVFSLFCMCAVQSSGVESARIVTPHSPPSETIQLAMSVIETALLEKNAAVSKYVGAPPDRPGDDLEVIVAVFDPQRMTSELPSDIGAEIAREPGAYTVMVFPRGGMARVYAIGGDEAGALYAAYDVADQVRATPSGSPISSRIEEKNASPSIPVRGVKRAVHSQALRDAFSWFHSEAYWNGFLDLLTHSRFNMLEIHGVLNESGPETGDIWPYFVDGGGATVASEQIARNRASLKRIIELAQQRGIHTTLTTGAPGSETPARIQASLRRLLGDFPGLDGLGMKAPVGVAHVAESLEGLIDSLNHAPRSPLLILKMDEADSNPARAAAAHAQSRVAVKIPMNACEFGLPYVHPGEATGQFKPVEYWDYLRRPMPYGALFAINTDPLAGVFPWVNVDSIRELLRLTTQVGANGFVLDSGSLFPCRRADCSHIPEEYRFAEWSHERQWHLFRIWGALAYNMALSREAIQAMFEERFGQESGAAMFEALERLSQALPAIHAVRPLDARAQGLPALLTPPPRLADIIAHPPGDPFTVRSAQEEVNSILEGSSDGRRSAFDTLHAALESTQAAIDSLERAGRTLNLSQRQPTGLLGASDIALFQEWRAWQLDARTLAELVRCWRDQVNAATQFQLYQRTGDIPSLLVASESAQAAQNAWEAALNLARGYNPLPVRRRDGVTTAHWSSMQTPFEEDRRRIERVYNEWAVTTEWDGKPAHFSPPAARPAQPILLTLSIPPSAQVFSLYVSYRNSIGRSQQLQLEASRIRGIYFAEIPPGDATEGLLEYFFTGRVNDRDFTLRGKDGQRAFLMSIRRDDEPPTLTRLAHGVSGEEMVIQATAIDPSGVAEARLLWRPLTRDGRWTTTPMRQVDSIFEGRLTLSGAGAIYAVEAVDMGGVAKRYPDPELGPPYRVIPANR